MDKTQPQYEIRIQGHLSPQRLRHFEGLTVRADASGETVIVGRFRDLSAVYGLLDWLQRLGVTLLLVRRQTQSNEQHPQGPTG